MSSPITHNLYYCNTIYGTAICILYAMENGLYLLKKPCISMLKFNTQSGYLGQTFSYKCECYHKPHMISSIKLSFLSESQTFT